MCLLSATTIYVRNISYADLGFTIYSLVVIIITIITIEIPKY